MYKDFKASLRSSKDFFTTTPVITSTANENLDAAAEEEMAELEFAASLAAARANSDATSRGATTKSTSPAGRTSRNAT